MNIVHELNFRERGHITKPIKSNRELYSAMQGRCHVIIFITYGLYNNLSELNIFEAKERCIDLEWTD
jgi:hypothetical protein